MICCIAGLKAQPFGNYINYTSKWGCKFVCGAPVPHIMYFSYFVNGDTSISGQDYFKLKMKLSNLDLSEKWGAYKLNK